MQYCSSVFDFSRSFKLLQRLASFFDLPIVTRASAAKMFLFLFGASQPCCTCINQYNSGSGLQRVQTVVFQLCDIWSVSTLLLIAVAIMASQVSVPAAGPAAPGLGCRATRFVCAKCTRSCQLSSLCLFLSRAAVLHHIAASNPCRASAAKLGFREIQVDVQTSDVMAGAGGGAGSRPTSDISQKVPCVGDVFLSVYIPCLS